MKIPSYDDLTPSIPDVHPRDTFDQVTRLVREPELPVVSPSPTADTSHAARRTSHVPHSTSHGAPSTSHIAHSTPHVAPGTSHGAPLFACVRTRTAGGAALLALARDFSPRIERYGDACVVLDVSGLGRLLGDGHGIAGELARTADARGLKVRIAVAPTYTAARLLTLARDEVTVATGDATHLLSTLPLERLGDLCTPPEPHLHVHEHSTAPGTPHVHSTAPGTPHVHSTAPGTVHGARAPFARASAPVAGAAAPFAAALAILRRWGLRTIGEFAALAPDDIAARFGQPGLAMHRLARGVDPRPLVPDRGVPRFLESMELEWPIDALEPLSFVLARLLEPLSLALERAGKGTAAIRLHLRLVDRTTHVRVLQLPAPMRDARVLRTLLQLDLDSHPPAAAIDVVTIEIDPAPGRIVQFSLLQRATPSPETVATLTARLGALVGDDRCGSPLLVDSHRPDAFEMRRFDPGGGGSSGVSGGAATAIVVRRFRPPVVIRVAVDRGRPVHVPIDRKGMPGGRVEQSAGPWRSSGAWWDATGAQWSRDEWDVAFADGAVCRIYRDHETGRWFMDGVVD